MAERKLDGQELDQILKKNTSGPSGLLQGVSFSVFNNNGGYRTFSAISFDMLSLSS